MEQKFNKIQRSLQKDKVGEFAIIVNIGDRVKIKPGDRIGIFAGGQNNSNWQIVMFPEGPYYCNPEEIIELTEEEKKEIN